MGDKITQCYHHDAGNCVITSMLEADNERLRRADCSNGECYTGLKEENEKLRARLLSIITEYENTKIAFMEKHLEMDPRLSTLFIQLEKGFQLLLTIRHEGEEHL